MVFDDKAPLRIIIYIYSIKNYLYVLILLTLELRTQKHSQNEKLSSVQAPVLSSEYSL